VIDAAEQTSSPVIVGFNGEFLARPDRALPARLEWYGALGRTAAELSRVPCAVMFNECPVDAWVNRAGEVGFNLVMLADPAANHTDLTRRIADVVRRAHSRDVAVEAELGTMPNGSMEHAGNSASLTDPESAVEFVRGTGVDALAVSVGNVHILLDGRCELDLTHLSAIHQRTNIPLVLHGGTGIADSSLGPAIELGVAKVNYGTYLKQRCLTAIRRALASPNGNPHHLLGDGGDDDLTVIVRRTVRDAVLERIGLLGCCGKS
jgi:fructose/tagatose bisphosphate aldolase